MRISQIELRKALDTLNLAVSRNNGRLAEYYSVHFTPDGDDAVRLTTTDARSTMLVVVKAVEPIDVWLDYRELVDAVKTLNKGCQVNISKAGVVSEYGAGYGAVNPVTVPSVIEYDHLHKFGVFYSPVATEPISRQFVGGVKSELLSWGLSASVVSTSTDDTRPVLTGVEVVALPGKLQFSGADSFRLSSVSTVADVAGDAKFIVPGDACRTLIKTLAACDYLEIHLLSYQRESMYFKGQMDDYRVIEFKAIDESFALYIEEIVGNAPNYRGIIPIKPCELVVTVDKAELASAVKWAKSTLKPQSKYDDGYLNVKFCDGMMISNAYPDKFFRLASLKIDLPDGVHLSLDSSLFADYIQFLRGSRVVMKAENYSGDAVSSCVIFTDEHDKFNDETFLVMPLHLANR